MYLRSGFYARGDVLRRPLRFWAYTHCLFDYFLGLFDFGHFGITVIVSEQVFF